MAGSVHYLTVQDVLWINTQLTKRVNHFRQVLLEEAVYHQYGYGSSVSVPSQAARFMSRLAKIKPIDKGSEATAFVGGVAFLRMNGFEVTIDDARAADWFTQVAAGGATAQDTIEQAVKHRTDDALGDADVRTVVCGVVSDFPAVIAALAQK